MPRGFVNVGNSRDVRAVMQGLASCPALLQELASENATPLCQQVLGLATKLRPVPRLPRNTETQHEDQFPWNQVARACQVLFVDAAEASAAAEAARQHGTSERGPACLGSGARQR